MRFLYLVGGRQNRLGGATPRDASLVRGLREAGHQVDAISVFGHAGADAENENCRLFRPLDENILTSLLYWFRRVSSGAAGVLLGGLQSPQQVGSAARGKALGLRATSLLSGSDGPRRREFQRRIAALAGWKGKIDIAVISSFMLSGLAQAIHDHVDCPVICLFQGGEECVEDLAEPYRSRARRLIRKNARQFDRVVTANQYSVIRAAETLAMPTSRIRVAQLCVESGSERAENRRRQPFIIGCLASIRHENSLDVLLDAVEDLDKRRPHLLAELWILGESGAPAANRIGSRRLLRHMAASPLGRRLRRLTGLPAGEQRKFLADLSVFVIPDRDDDVEGIRALEAMAAGIPIIGPETATLKEIHSSAAGGIMLAPNLAPGMIAKTLEYLADYPETADELGRRGLAGVASHFSREKSAQKLFRIAEELLAGESA
jgi:glycosyltransferase involved in cell wall biosynthesis